MSKAEIAQNYPNGIHNYNDIIRDEHRSRFEVGAWTDDTDQFLCIDKSIKKYGFVNSLDIAQEFKNWYIIHYGRNSMPNGREITDYMDKVYGKCNRGKWLNVEVLYNDDDNDDIESD